MGGVSDRGVIVAERVIRERAIGEQSIGERVIGEQENLVSSDQEVIKIKNTARHDTISKFS